MTEKFEKWTPEWTGDDLALSRAMQDDLDRSLNALQHLRDLPGGRCGPDRRCRHSWAPAP